MARYERPTEAELELERKANELLRKAGCCHDGRTFGAVAGGQRSFERRHVRSAGIGGYSRRKR